MSGPKKALVKRSHRFSKDSIQELTNVHEDGSFTGFALKGHKLRWITAKVQAKNPGRIWLPLKVSDLDPEFVSGWKERYNHLRCAEDGDTIRRNEMILFYASNAAVKEQRIKHRKLQMRHEATIKTENKNVKRGLVTEIEEAIVPAPPAGL